MALALTQHTLEKLETLYKQLGFRVRYEKGNFKTGACTLDKSKVIVINKFANLENRIMALAALAREIPSGEDELDEKNRQFFLSLKQIELEL